MTTVHEVRLEEPTAFQGVVVVRRESGTSVYSGAVREMRALARYVAREHGLEEVRPQVWTEPHRAAVAR